MKFQDEAASQLLRDNEERQKRLRARNDLLVYASVIDIPNRRLDKSVKPLSEEERDEFKFIPRMFASHHILWLQKLQEVADGKIKRLMGLFPPGSGKALALDTPIPTPNGWKTIGELKVGDQVFGDDGNPCNVVWVSPIWQQRPCYEVTTDCGDKIIADQDHEWLVSCWIRKGENRTDKLKLRTTKELSEKRYLVNTDYIRKNGTRSKRPMIVRAAPIDLPEKDLLIDPYILGVWLGDGTTLYPDISAGKADVFWWESEFNRLGLEINILGRRDDNKKISFLGMRDKFRALGLMGGNSSDPKNMWGKKFIPKEYLRGSLDQRYSLLQGLIDTDGYVSPGGMVCFTNTNFQLVHGVAELVRSLGAKAFITGPHLHKLMVDGQEVECAPTLTVTFYLKNAARMPRKAALTKDGTRTPNTYIDVKPYGKADTVCIEVDSPNHMFLCGRSMTPTHNSLFTSVCFPTYYLGRFPRSKVIVTGYGSDLPKKQGRWARTIASSEMYKRVFNCTISDESAAVDEWALTNGSEWYARGILAGITGQRADGIIWDDLIKGRDEADSQLIRDKTWDAYMNDLQTRRNSDDTWEIGIECLTGDTPVAMGDGSWKPMRDIKIGDEVLSKKNLEIVRRKVLNWKSQGEDDIFEVRTGGGKVKANARHPFLVARNVKPEWRRQFVDIKGADLEWVRVKDLKKGDVIVTQSKFPVEKEKGILTEKQAWLLGYMFGDGWITVRNAVQYDKKGRGPYPRRGFVTSVAISNDGFENEKVAHLFEEIFDTRPKSTKYDTWVTERQYIGKWFISMGLVGKAKTKRLPAYIFSEPENIRLAFLDGYICADGYIRSDRRIHLGSCNINLLTDFKVLARGLGYRVTNISVQQKWQQPPGSPKPVFATLGHLQFSPDRINNTFIGRAITSITSIGKEEVFDLQVEETENFIADGIVVSNTRWHEDDPPGRILPYDYNGQSGWVKGRDGNDWYIVCLPAICEREDDPLGRQVGERLWPEHFSDKHYAPFMLDARTWSSLFQQRPAPDAGTFFEEQWIRPCGEGTHTPIPNRDTMHVYGASDYATTEKGGDYTVHIVVGVDEYHDVYILDLWRKRTTPDKWAEVFCDLVEKWRPIGWAEETGQIKAGVGPFLHRMMLDRQIYMPRKGFPTKGDKSVRAQSIRGRMGMGKVYFPVQAPWFPELRRELLIFPAGAHDDIVDSLGLIGQILDLMIRGSPKRKEKEKAKLLSVNPEECTVTLEDLFEANEKRNDRNKSLRIW